MEAMLHSPNGSTVLGTGTISIGTTADNQLVLNDASVGAHHAEIRPEGQGHSIIDLGTNAGTVVNGLRLYPQVPQLLQNGDAITIGSTQLTYETRSSSGVAPTVFASPGSSSVPPTVMASGSAGGIPPTVYGSYADSSSPYSLPSSTTPPPPVAAPITSSAPPPPTSGYSIDPYGSSAPKKKSRRGLWIALSVVGVVLVIIIVFIAMAGGGSSSTPTQTFQAYCSALKSKDANTAYGLYSSAAKPQTSVDAMKAVADSTSDCAVSNVDDTAGTAVITYTFTDGARIVEDDKVIQENGSWKIDAQKLRETPSLTLYNYCNALVQGDYQTAYNQFSSTYQSQQSESQFANSFPDGKPTACTISNVDDTAGKGVVTMTIKGTQAAYNETLVNENGSWKISSEQQQK